MYLVSVSVPDSVGYDLQANEISEDSYKISWKVSTEVFF
jgi:hypothetical protein